MLSNITSINLSLQTQGAAFVARAISRLAQPARRIYVFGGASDVFPYFSTFANALTYANSLDPSTSEPVSIVLLSQQDGTPFEITGEQFTEALLQGIYVSSPYNAFGVTVITYEDLIGLADGGSLVAGGKYLISDYETVWVDNVIELSQTWGGVAQSSGVVEPLMVTALSATELEPIAFSPNNPKNVIHYDLRNDTNKYDWAHVTGKGVIYRMIDEKGNSLPYDFKQIRFNVVEIDFDNIPTWNSVPTYTYGQMVKTVSGSTVSLWIMIKGFGQSDSETSTNENPASDASSLIWRQIRSWNTTTQTMMRHIVPNGEIVSDHFGEDEYSVQILFDENCGGYFYLRIKDIEPSRLWTFNEITTIADSTGLSGVYANEIADQIISGARRLYANVFIGNNFYFNTIGNNFYSNTIGNNFYSNTIGNNFYSNMIGTGFYSNMIGTGFYSNMIGNNFVSNMIVTDFASNTIGNNFFSNTIGNNFYFNMIGTDFVFNTIGNNFYFNTIGNNFYSNTIGNNFYFNTIGNNIQMIRSSNNVIGLSPSTTNYSEIVGKDYTVEVFRTSSGGVGIGLLENAI